MVRTNYLDQGSDVSIADSLIQFREESGYPPEEFIPGLIMAVILLAEAFPDPEEILDEAANLLADGPSMREI